MIPFTTCIALDAAHLVEACLSVPTWLRHRPEIWRQPLRVMVDAVLPIGDVLPLFSDHPDCELIPVPDVPGWSQRERMLAAFVFIAPWVVETPWLLKLDTDTVAVKPSADWCEDALIEPNEQGRVPCHVSSGWNYTKPADAVKVLDDWGDTVPGIREHPRLNLPYDPASKLVVTKGRIISWCFFGRTDWCRDLSKLCGRRLPIPSQDSVAWFVVCRRGEFYRTVRMRHYGWTHVSGRHLERVCKEAMA